MAVTTTNFGDCLTQARRRRRLLQKTLALTAGLDPSYVAGLERGRRRPPKPALIDRLVMALRADPVERERLLAAAAADRLAHAIARHESEIQGAGVLARIAGCLPQLAPEDLITLERVAIGFSARGTNDSYSQGKEGAQKEKTA